MRRGVPEIFVDSSLDSSIARRHVIAAASSQCLIRAGNFSSDMCRAAVGGSLADFLKYARNPTFAQLVDHESWSGKLGNRIPATQTRGALATTMVTVQTNRGQERKFLWTLVPVRKIISRRWRGTSTLSSRRSYGDNIASMAWGA